MRAIMKSISPKECERIVSGEQTILISKTRPKIETPFKCYIYCTKGKDLLREIDCWHTKAKIHTTNYKIINLDYCTNKIANGKVIGDFVCDRIEEIYPLDDDNPISEELKKQTCLSCHEMVIYLSGRYQICGYGWHISDLKIYDKPKELGEFKRSCSYKGTCYYCARAKFESDGTRLCDNKITRPPQSWCYVEEL